MIIFARFIFRKMQNQHNQTSAASASEIAEITVYSILLSISLTHLLNDTIQSLLPSIYPVVKNSFELNFPQIGIITLVFQSTASLFQPLIGFYTGRKPQPYSCIWFGFYTHRVTGQELSLAFCPGGCNRNRIVC